MSEYMPEDPGVGAVNPPLPVDPVQSDDGIELSRYMIHVPLKDNNGREIPHVLAMLRQSLTTSGFHGRTVIPLTQGDWQGEQDSYDTEEMAIVMVDADSSPETLEAIKEAARGVKEAAGQEAVYLTVQPLRTYLI